ncbi:hypothetical protein [Nocardia brasiliensis]|uniref:hypothetical protein n=1 Tax=Nocardia brasiliensis TaxID=37326 RepID=UPI00245416F9|nr:hypothetical protein [Nocardia brasiliensis]
MTDRIHGETVFAPGYPDPVTVVRRWQWPFPYAEVRTRKGVEFAVPVSRLRFAGDEDY